MSVGDKISFAAGTVVNSVGALFHKYVEITATAAELNIMDGVTATYDELNILEGVTATAAELNEAADKSGAAVVSLTGTVSITQALHAGRICTLDAAAGFTATLPEASGTGDVYTFIVGTAATSNSYIIATADAANADIAGVARGQDMDDDTVTNFAAQQGDGFDLITLNRTTTGGVNVGGDRIVLIDVATDVWRCDMDYMVPTGSNPATPFSST